MAARDLDEERIAFGGPDGGDVTDGPDQDACKP